ncbi:MAG: Crp/Fnr family transcriptional regulator [Chitinophagaceae bacterium]|nr:MAG: Crp/Fnr family transcriptional regulator [Chitinophagaceae bacterium]
MTNELELLRKTVNAVYALTQDEWEMFAASWRLKTVSRKQVITVAGQQENYLYFVTGGVQRIFHLDEQGREATILFTYAPSFGGVIDSLLLQQPSNYYYETLTGSTFLQLSFRELETMMKSNSSINAFIRKALSISLSGLLERIVDLQCYSSEEKFRKLLQRSPHILQLVPHKYLASYLGMDATNFSKLLNSVRI